MFRYIHILSFCGIVALPLCVVAAPTDSTAPSGKAASSTREANENESEKASRDAIRAFVLDLISKEQARDIDSLIQLYADRIMVDGKPESRDQLKTDLDVYFKRWPEAAWSMEGNNPHVEKKSDGSCEVNYAVTFEVSNPAHSEKRKGEAIIYLTLQKNDETYLITAYRNKTTNLMISSGPEWVVLSPDGKKKASILFHLNTDPCIIKMQISRDNKVLIKAKADYEDFDASESFFQAYLSPDGNLLAVNTRMCKRGGDSLWIFDLKNAKVLKKGMDEIGDRWLSIAAKKMKKKFRECLMHLFGFLVCMRLGGIISINLK